MGVETFIASAASKALTSLTTQIDTYFADQSWVKREFSFPAAAFVLGCLGILMAIVGPEAPRAWWASLGTDVKLLVTAVMVYLLIVVAEVSRLLVATVRRLFSGEWPNWPLWQRWLREPFLRDRLERDREDRLLVQAEGILNQTLNDLEGLGSPGAQAAPTVLAPVPRASIPAYRLISGGDWEWKELAEASAKGCVTAPADLVGRYAVVTLLAGEPIPSDKLRSLPNPAYLAPSRQVLTLSVLGDVAAQSKPGMVVTFAPVKPDAKLLPVPDVLLLGQADDGRWVVSVAADQAKALESLLFEGDFKLVTCSTVAVPWCVLPVAGTQLAAGQLVERDQIAWEVLSGQAPEGSAVHERDVLGRMYWPVDRQKPLPKGTCFALTELAPAPRRDWLVYEENDKVRYRAACPLPIPLPHVEIKWDCGEGKHDELAKSMDDCPIEVGDCIQVTLDKDHPTCYVEGWCYVYHKDSGGLVIAVQNPAEFAGRLAKASTMLLSPFCQVAVLKVEHRLGQLISADDLDEVPFRANSLKDVCMDKAQVINRYVTYRDGPLVPGEPISRRYLALAIPDDHTVLALASPQGEPLSVTMGPEFKPSPSESRAPLRRGDVVSVCLNPTQSGLSGIPWDGALVCQVSMADHGFSELRLTVPRSLYAQAQQLWTSGATITLSHVQSDVFFYQTLQDLEHSVSRAENPRKLNEFLSTANPQEDRLKAWAEDMRRVADRLIKLYRSMEAHPWQSVPLIAGHSYQAADAHFWNLFDRIRTAVQYSYNATRRIAENRKRGTKLVLPDDVADIRPTELGNVLAAAAYYPSTAYGIDTATILPRLLDVLTADVAAVKRLTSTESSMNMLLLFSFWSGVWTALGALALLVFHGAWWMFPVVTIGGPLLCWLTKEAATDRAFAYGEALKSVFDSQRHKLLYDLDIHPPDQDQTTERDWWGRLSELYAFGKARDFTPPLKKETVPKGGQV